MPAWTNPKTWTAALVTVAEMNTHLRDNTLYLYQARVAGVVNIGGTVAAGTLFSSVKDSTGQYSVTFSSAFPARPVVVITAEGGSAIIAPVLTAVSAAAFTVQFRNSASGLTDQAFDFIALLAV